MEILDNFDINLLTSLSSAKKQQPQIDFKFLSPTEPS